MEYRKTLIPMQYCFSKNENATLLFLICILIKNSSDAYNEKKSNKK